MSIFNKKKKLSVSINFTETTNFNDSNVGLKDIKTELPFGWITHNKEFVDDIRSKEQYFLNLYITADSVRKKRDSLTSLLMFVSDLEIYSKRLGKYHEIFIQEAYTENETFMKMIAEKKEELKNIEDNFDELIRKEKERNTLKDDVIIIIKENPGIIQKNLYKKFPDCVRYDISNIVYEMSKEGFIKREKSGNSYILNMR